jgi:hypothetical protein
MKRFSFSPYAEQVWDPFSLLSDGFRDSFPEVKQLGHRADHLLLSSVYMKHMWTYPSIPPYAFMTQ